jgi:hypothetical protein
MDQGPMRRCAREIINAHGNRHVCGTCGGIGLTALARLHADDAVVDLQLRQQLMPQYLRLTARFIEGDTQFGRHMLDHRPQTDQLVAEPFVIGFKNLKLRV